jgi:hypothetical protein
MSITLCLLLLLIYERPKNQEGLEFYAIHQLLVFADDADISGENMNGTRKTQKKFLRFVECWFTSKQRENCIYVLSRHGISGHNHNLRMSNKSNPKVLDLVVHRYENLISRN